VGLPAQEAGQTLPQQPSQTVIRATGQEVLLDVIIRDKKGKSILDLKPEEIEVNDEGGKMKLTGFRLVTGTAEAGLAPESEAAAAPKRYDPMRQLRLVSLVFEGLDNEARLRSRAAANEFLKNELQQNVYLAVFTIDQRLHVIQQFTNDRGLLAKAIERATTGHLLDFTAQSDAIRKELEQVRRSQSASAEAAAAAQPGRGSPGAGSAAGNYAEARMAQLTLDILSFSEKLTRMQASRASIFSILSLVKEQAPLPGRKTVVYFSDGIEVEESMVEQFRSMIGTANRAGVSIYGVDARGLTLEAQTGASTGMLREAAGSSMASTEGGSVTSDQVRIFDTARGSIHANRQQSLENLSQSTGGFMIANTNDLRAPLRRISEDVLTFYELAYTPPITDFDGKFRRIEVKVKRSGLKVQARSGYFALPPNSDSVFAYEVPLLRALSSPQLPASVPYRTGALRFGKQEDKIEYSLVVEVPLKGLKPVEDKKNKRYNTRLSVLALVKDQQGQIVQRFSRDYPFHVPKDRLAAFQEQIFLEKVPMSLGPGRYTLESSVMDAEGLQVGAKRASLVVPPPVPGVAISSLALVRRSDPVPPQATPDSYHYQGTRIVPTLDTNVQVTPGGAVSFFFVVFPSPSIPDKPLVVFELSREGVSLGRLKQELPDPDQRGAIPNLASFPLDQLKPGQYELVVVARQGASLAEQRSVFVVNQ
jgi:VWFA-related protein